MRSSSSPVGVIPISDSLDPLKAAFNSAHDVSRLVILVSPTCGFCLQGASAVFEIVQGLGPESKLAVFVVWIDMLPADNGEAARRQAARMPDPRITHFHDGTKRAGSAIAMAMGARDRVAWDMYLVYPPGIFWEAAAPKPQAWVHQLLGALWADPLRYRTGWLLKRGLARLVAAAEKGDPAG
jgi:hypothetical protein